MYGRETMARRCVLYAWACLLLLLAAPAAVLSTTANPAETTAAATSSASFTSLVPVPAWASNQAPWTYGQTSTLLNYFGAPCVVGASTCSPVTASSLNGLLVPVRVGPLTGFPTCLTGMNPAVRQLKSAFAATRDANPALYRALGTAGMLCCRYIGGTTTFSNHAWGSAIDIKIGGQLDPYDDGTVQQGLVDLYPYMHAAGFFWGASWSKEDGMHFEVSNQRLLEWQSNGNMTVIWPSVPADAVGLVQCQWPAIAPHTSGSPVQPLAVVVQLALTHHCTSAPPHGYFGSDSQAALESFQQQRGLTPADSVAIFSGSVVPAETWRALWEEQRFGDESYLVGAIQQLITIRAGVTTTRTNKFDGDLQGAVTGWQRSRGLGRQDGVVDFETWQSLVCGCGRGSVTASATAAPTAVAPTTVATTVATPAPTTVAPTTVATTVATPAPTTAVPPTAATVAVTTEASSASSTVPPVAFLATPPTVTFQRYAVFLFRVAGPVQTFGYQCAQDGFNFSPCVSPKILMPSAENDFETLSTGLHTFRVRACTQQSPSVCGPTSEASFTIDSVFVLALARNVSILGNRVVIDTSAGAPAYTGTNVEDKTPFLKGIFRTQCLEVTNIFDDPIVFPNQPGASHLHSIWGNRNIDATMSTAMLYASTDSAGTAAPVKNPTSACQGDDINRSGYWVPALLAPIFDALGVRIGWRNVRKDADLNAIAAGLFHETFYYSATVTNVSSITRPPVGLKIVAGNPMRVPASTAQQIVLDDPLYITHWYCAIRGSAAGLPLTRTEYIPACNMSYDANNRPNMLVHYVVRFPSCWNGVSLDSPDHQSHMAYPVFGVNAMGRKDPSNVKCPSSHPVPIPEVSYHYSFAVDETNADPLTRSSRGWRLASDMYVATDATPGGYSVHGDWWNAWDPVVMQAWIDGCLIGRRDCHNGQLGVVPQYPNNNFVLGPIANMAVPQPAPCPSLANVALAGLRANIPSTSCLALASNITASLVRFVQTALTPFNALPSTSGARGAILLAPSPAMFVSGAAFRRVQPYFSHLAAIGLLQASNASAITSVTFPIVSEWLLWNFRKMVARGIGAVVDYLYDAQGNGGACVSPNLCDFIDAEDSTAALLLGVFARYAQATEFDISALRQPGDAPDLVEASLALAVGTLANLTQPDGLLWAKMNYPVKYLMDNSEVAWGLESAGHAFSSLLQRGRLSQAALGARASPAALLAAAAKIRNALRSHWAVPLSEGFAWWQTGLSTTGSFSPVNVSNVFYPDALAQIWPTIFGGVQPLTSAALVETLVSAWPCQSSGSGPCNGFFYPAIGLASAVAGLPGLACDQMFALSRSVDFTAPVYPFHVGDVGQMLQTCAAVASWAPAMTAVPWPWTAPAGVPPTTADSAAGTHAGTNAATTTNTAATTAATHAAFTATATNIAATTAATDSGANAATATDAAATTGTTTAATHAAATRTATNITTTTAGANTGTNTATATDAAATTGTTTAATNAATTTATNVAATTAGTIAFSSAATATSAAATTAATTAATNPAVTTAATTASAVPVTTCASGFAGAPCSDINECVGSAGGLATHNCAASVAVCSNTAGSFTCACIAGYSGNGVSCSQINECTSGLSNCHSHAACQDTSGSFTCQCNKGYVGNGVLCEDANECTTGANNCNGNAACSNTVGSFACACKPGFIGNGVECADVNECTSGLHNCAGVAICSNTVGSFVCSCQAGYSGNGVTCADVNECTTGRSNCASGATCTNTAGSFTCACTGGYTGNGVQCAPICGDGLLKPGEACDDGNTNGGDGCSSTCTVEAGWSCGANGCQPVCGDGIRVGGETCDDGNTASSDGCSSSCTVEAGWTCAAVASAPSMCTPICGDGRQMPGEQCDTGAPSNGCAQCKIQPGWSCSGGSPTAPSVCHEGCGNGVLGASEGCDDGNLANGDGCSDVCTVETGWVCPAAGAACTAVCGDGVVSGQACDNKNTVSGDGCSADCSVESGYTCHTTGTVGPSACTRCGDGKRGEFAGEACDDGNTNGGDGCSSACTVESGWHCVVTATGDKCSRCGDGVVLAPEACDDGNGISGDGCSASCAVEPHWQCSIQASTSETASNDGSSSPAGGPSVCSCEVGWGGPSCTCQPSSTCSGHGRCVGVAGGSVCECHRRYFGVACAVYEAPVAATEMLVDTTNSAVPVVLALSAGASDRNGSAPAVALSLPPGALSSPTTLSIEEFDPSLLPASRAALDAVIGSVVDLHPTGTRFDAAVTLSLAFTLPGDHKEGERYLVHWFNFDTNAFEAVPQSTFDAAEGVSRCPLTHFSYYAVLRSSPDIVALPGPSSTREDSDRHAGGLSGGAIAGIVLVSIAAVGAAIAAIAVAMKRRHNGSRMAKSARKSMAVDASEDADMEMQCLSPPANAPDEAVEDALALRAVTLGQTNRGPSKDGSQAVAVVESASLLARVGGGDGGGRRRTIEWIDATLVSEPSLEPPMRAVASGEGQGPCSCGESDNDSVNSDAEPTPPPPPLQSGIVLSSAPALRVVPAAAAQHRRHSGCDNDDDDDDDSDSDGSVGSPPPMPPPGDPPGTQMGIC